MMRSKLLIVFLSNFRMTHSTFNDDAAIDDYDNNVEVDVFRYTHRRRVGDNLGATVDEFEGGYIIRSIILLKNVECSCEKFYIYFSGRHYFYDSFK